MQSTLNDRIIRHPGAQGPSQLRPPATSYPLIVIGAVGFHYASFQLNGWIQVTYGLPLAFVLVWALQWRHERRTGVGPGHDEVLAIAFAVFLGTSLALSDTWRALLPSSFGDYSTFWVFAPTAAGLAAIGARQRRRSLIAWGAAIAAACALGDAIRDSWLQPAWSDASTSYQTFIPQIVLLVATASGLDRFRRESAAAR